MGFGGRYPIGLASRYNGTPRGVTNCHDGEHQQPIFVHVYVLIVKSGGCAQCNQTSNACDVDCLCLHAEENALLEAGRDRVGTNAIMYCNTLARSHCYAVSILTPVSDAPASSAPPK